MKAALMFIAFTVLALRGFSQAPADPSEFAPDAVKEAMFFPYLAVHHGGPEATLKWKQSNTLQYYRELWYFCESFSIQRNYLQAGEQLNEAIIDISRFESHRHSDTAVAYVIAGYRDAIVLQPRKTLKYFPDYLK